MKKKRRIKYPETVKPYGVAYYTEIVHKNLCVHLAGESVLQLSMASKRKLWNSPGGPVIETPLQKAQVQPLARELRS